MKIQCFNRLDNKKGSLFKKNVIIGTLFFFIVSVMFVWKQNYSFNYIDSESMEPTIHKNTFIVCKKVNEETQLHRGDIITFRYPLDKSEVYVKRIIGLPGEKVSITNGIVTINEKKINEYYITNKWTRGMGDYNYEIPEASYLVLGDNRNNSEDSRYWNEKYMDLYGEYNENISYVSRKDILAVY